jgi:alpha-D-ribose 1-methylphosphonate 5-triphosphate synthase subunit PhnL
VGVLIPATEVLVAVTVRVGVLTPATEVLVGVAVRVGVAVTVNVGVGVELLAEPTVTVLDFASRVTPSLANKRNSKSSALVGMVNVHEPEARAVVGLWLQFTYFQSRLEVSTAPTQ